MANSTFPFQKLCHLCLKIGSGITPRGGSKVYLEKGKIAFIRSQNIQNIQFTKIGLVYLQQIHADQLSNVSVEQGDVLLNITGDSVARCCQVDLTILPARVNQHVAIIRPNKKKLNSEFLKYFLVSPSMQQFMLGLAGAGATRSALTKSMIESFEIPVPDVDEQQRIAGILGTLDYKIELNRQMNETLEAIAQALFKSWFIDFDPVIDKALAARKEIPEAMQEKAAFRQTLGNQRKPLPQEIESLFPDEFVESELGWIPQEWEVNSLDKVADLITKSVKPFEEPEVKWNHYSIPAFDAGQIPVLESGASIMSHKYNVPTNSVLISKLNPKTPRVWIPSSDKMFKAVCSTEFMPIVPVVANERPFLWAMLCTPDTSKHLLDRVTGTSGSHQRVSPGDIKKLLIVNPGSSIRALFSRLMEPILQKILAIRSDSKKLGSLRNTLLPKLISGEIRIAEAEDMLAEAVYE